MGVRKRNEKALCTSLHITTDDTTVLDENILKLADTSIHGNSADEKSHLKTG